MLSRLQNGKPIKTLSSSYADISSPGRRNNTNLRTMKLFLIGAILGALVAPAFALPRASSQNRHIIHEKRDAIGSRLIQSGELDPNHIVPARIGLKQSNIDLGAKYLYEMYVL